MVNMKLADVAIIEETAADLIARSHNKVSRAKRPAQKQRQARTTLDGDDLSTRLRRTLKKILRVPSDDGEVPGYDPAAELALTKAMYKRYRPYEPTHFAIVNRARDLMSRLERIRALEEALLFDAGELGKRLRDAFGADPLVKLVKYETEIASQLKKMGPELKELDDWHLAHDLSDGVCDLYLESPGAEHDWFPNAQAPDRQR